MLAHRDNGKYVKWNLESTAELLLQRCPDNHIWIIKPQKMHLKTFSVFSNFVCANSFGVPEHSENQASWQHLQEVLKTACHILTRRLDTVTDGFQECDTNKEFSSSHSCTIGRIVPNYTLPLTLIGFSKGCVVLNQLLYDLPPGGGGEATDVLIGRVDHMYWLDGGHNGGSNTWITHENILEKLVSLKVHVHVHVTPYQMKDDFRKWIGKEEKMFVKKLKKMQMNIEEKVHFATVERSLLNHFLLLEQF